MGNLYVLVQRIVRLVYGTSMEIYCIYLKDMKIMITSLIFSNDGKHLLTGSWDKTVRLWDMHGKILQVFKGHEAEIEGVTFSPDDKTILTGSDDKTARLWDLDRNIFTGDQRS